MSFEKYIAFWKFWQIEIIHLMCSLFKVFGWNKLGNCDFVFWQDGWMSMFDLSKCLTCSSVRHVQLFDRLLKCPTCPIVRHVQLSDMSNCLESPTMSKMSKCTPFPSVRHVKLSAKYCPPHLSNIVLILLLLLESLTKKLQHFLIGFLKMLTMTFQSTEARKDQFLYNPWPQV